MESPPADLSAYSAEAGQVEFLQACSRVTGDTPADLISHPVPYPGENGLVEQEGLEGGPHAADGQPAETGECESRIQHFHGETLPGIHAGLVEVDAPELPLV